jgi:hypothetical protein
MPEENKEFLEIQKEFDKLKTMYKEDLTQQSFNCLVLGEMGTGKSHLLQTCRRPIHIDSFDPGGTKHLQKGISEGWIMVDTRYEKEDPLKPTAADLWRKEMERRFNMGYFNHLGTYSLDSMTMWNEAIMNEVLRKAGIAGQAPRFTHDFSPAKNQIKNYIQMLVRLPCDVVITGHIRPDKDEVVGSVSMRLVTIGNLDTLIPSLFDEVYITQIRDGSKGPEYSILTAPKGHYRHVRTRMGSGKFDQVEKPDIRELLKKAGHNNSDKEKGGA